MINFDLKFYEKEIKPLLNNHDAENWSIEFERGVENYLKRINKIGLDLEGVILDAGGGAGNWSIPLSIVNKHVELIDIADGRLLIAHQMCKQLSIENITLRHMSIEKMVFPNQHFDAILCYSVIMFTNVEKTLNEFYRVLKPGGRLYIQADLWRWYLRHASHAKTSKTNYLTKFLLKKLIFGKPILLTQKSFKSMIKKAGFELVGIGQDGETSFDSDSKSLSVKSFYEPQTVGREEIIEVCATRI